MLRGRRIAFDYGDVRIGVATCDPDAILCTPLPPLDSTSDSLKLHIEELIKEYEPIYIAVGEPKHLSGAESAKMRSVEEFVELLSSITNLPIRLIDERFSTVSAASKLKLAGKDSRESRTLIDSAAAAEILERAIAMESHFPNE
jgi:putative Holliday junction resolvase